MDPSHLQNQVRLTWKVFLGEEKQDQKTVDWMWSAQAVLIQGWEEVKGVNQPNVKLKKKWSSRLRHLRERGRPEWTMLEEGEEKAVVETAVG
jgi:hypothetical protein